MLGKIPFAKTESVVDVADHWTNARNDLAQVIARDAKRFAPIGKFFGNIDIDAA